MFELIGIAAVLYIGFKFFRLLQRAWFSKSVINGAVDLGVPLNEARRIWYQEAEKVYDLVVQLSSQGSILVNATPAGKSSWAIKFIYDGKV